MSGSVYDDMRAVLSEMGIPSTEIAFIHDFETPAQKQKPLRGSMPARSGC